MLRNHQLSVAINFLFPELSTYSDAHQEIRKFIRNEYENLGTSVLYYLNPEFMDLISSLSLSIGTKEVIVTEKAVRATNNFSNAPKIIFEI